MASFHILLLLSSVTYYNSVVICSLSMHNIKYNDRNQDQTNIGLLDESRRIIGGHYVTNISRFPYMAYLYLNSRILLNATLERWLRKACGATILTKKHALTAAHCLKTCNCDATIDDDYCSNCQIVNPNNLHVYAGSTVPNVATLISQVKHFYIHPNHKFVDIKHNCLHNFDIAVLELTEPITFSDKIRPVRLPRPVPLNPEIIRFQMAEFFSKHVKPYCTIIGWDFISYSNLGEFLQEKMRFAFVPMIPQRQCINHISRHLYRGSLSKGLCQYTTLCTESSKGDTGVCDGDSGGPLMYGDVQVGVASWVFEDCVGPTMPSVFTRLDINVPWILNIIKKNITTILKKKIITSLKKFSSKLIACIFRLFSIYKKYLNCICI